jgi:hypothetical protein
MAPRNYVPSKGAAFQQWANAFVAYLESSAERINFPADTLKQIKELHTDFTQKYAISEAPATRTKLTVLDKSIARSVLEKAIRQAVREFLSHNHLVTDTDRDGLGIPIRKTTHTPAPVATTIPEYEVDSSIIRILTIHFADQGNKRSKAKPPGQHGAELRWEILDAPPTSIRDLRHSAFNTRTPITLEFDEEYRGKTVYFCICWENTRGEKGPRSAIARAVIP